jgi:hypothetical protein
VADGVPVGVRFVGSAEQLLGGIVVITKGDDVRPLKQPYSAVEALPI